MKSKYIIIIFIALFLAACSSNRIYHEIHTFNDYKWLRNDTIAFTVNIDDEHNHINYWLQFNIRYITGFQYQFLNLNILVITPDGDIFSKVESIQVRKDNSDYIGDVAGSYWDIDHTMKDKFTFKKKGKYLIKISPIVDEGRIYFINELGLSVLNKQE